MMIGSDFNDSSFSIVQALHGFAAQFQAGRFELLARHPSLRGITVRNLERRLLWCDYPLRPHFTGSLRNQFTFNTSN